MKLKSIISPSVIGIAGLAVLAGCKSGTERSAKPNVVYILTDQWRASAFGYAGDPNVKTPNIDRFSQKSVNFRNAVSVCPVSTPHRASLMTGRYPTSTGMFLNDLYLPSEELCMAEIFKTGGYQTAYLGKWHLDGHGRMNNVKPERRQGFDFWKGLECSHAYNKMGYYENDDPELKFWPGYSPFAVADEANRYLERHAEDKDPFLLFVSIAAPHFPHNSAPEEMKELYPQDQLKLNPNVSPAKEKAARRELRGYYAHCTATDKAIGKIFDKLEALGLMENTIVVFTSDHGEMMGAHNVRPFEKQLVWDESIKVPFLISYPGIGDNRGKTVNAPINTPDILPSLLGLAGMDVPESIEGEDISALMRKPDPEADRAALVMGVCPFGGIVYPYDEFRAVRTARYSYVRNVEKAVMLFDNVADPYQMDNLLDKPEYAGLQGKLDKELYRQLKKVGDEFKERRYYIGKWNLVTNKWCEIDYHHQSETNFQSPRQ